MCVYVFFCFFSVVVFFCNERIYFECALTTEKVSGVETKRAFLIREEKKKKTDGERERRRAIFRSQRNDATLTTSLWDRTNRSDFWTFSWKKLYMVSSNQRQQPQWLANWCANFSHSPRSVWICIFAGGYCWFAAQWIHCSFLLISHSLPIDCLHVVAGLSTYHVQ